MAGSGDIRQKRHRGRTWPPDMIARVKNLALEHPGLSAKGVSDQLKEEEFKGKDVPSERTLRDLLKEFRPPEPTETWSLAKASDEEAALVLPVLREVIERSGGEVTSFSTAMAEQVARIRRLVPDKPWPATLLTFWDLYVLAVEYLLAKERKQLPTGADAYLAFAPWRGLEEVMRYEQALKEGRIPPRLLPPELKKSNEAEHKQEDEDGEAKRQ